MKFCTLIEITTLCTLAVLHQSYGVQLTQEELLPPRTPSPSPAGFAGVPLNPFHPLDPLSALELQGASQIIRTHFKQIPLVFSTVTLKEPLKADLLHYFLEDIAPPSTIPRRAFAVVIDPITQTVYEVVVDLRLQAVESLVKVPHGLQPMIAFDEGAGDDITAAILADESVQGRLYGLGITNLSLVVPIFWDFGYAGDRPEYLGRRIFQASFFTRNYPNDNNYAHPMGFIAIVDALQKRVLDIEDLPIHSGFDATNRQGDSVPLIPQNYDPTLLPQDFFRKDVSPITVTQDAGAGYRVSGNQIEWQNFRMRIGFNDREGLVLHHINYNDKGHVRPLIYRAALSELFVPYGDPRPPFHRKMVFDVGQYGIGLCSHELFAPSDCKGSVKFLDVITNNKAGLPVTTRNAICIYEEDAGSLMKKYDNEARRSYSVQSQRLVITFTSTTGNYDYQFKWMFYQDASIQVEAALHGVVNPTFIATGSTSGVHGTILAPGINTQYHQHFFVVRLDTEIDGNENTVATMDVVPSGSTGSAQNPYGNGFTAIQTLLRNQSQARTKASPTTARMWSILGDLKVKHPFANTPMGYKLIAQNPNHLMMNLDSPLHPKCAFVDYDVWVTPYREDQLYAGGFYLNSSGLPEWVGQNLNANVENTDIVLWHVFGVTHIPRVEDFPVMPMESAGFWLRPNNFFMENPALDLPSFLHNQNQ